MNRMERDRYIAWVGFTNNDSQIWGQYERLVDFIFEDFPKTGRRFEEIALPTLFIFSHALELALKENIKFFKIYHGSNHFTKFEDWTQLLKSHDLDALTFEFRAGYFKLHAKVDAPESDKIEFLKYLKDLEKLVEFLNRNTETYRYALKLDNAGKTIKPSIEFSKKIDLYELKELFEKTKTLFIGAPNSLGRFTDFIDFSINNPDYKKGKGYLFCQKLHYTDHFLKEVKKMLSNRMVSLNEEKWMDSVTGENFEIQIWNGDIYIVCIQ